MISPIDFVKRRLTLSSDRIRALPVLVLMPHSRCNCRCVMCDIWKANADGREISLFEISRHIDSLKKLRVRRVVLSGGEPIMHSNLWAFCEKLKQAKVRITLLSTGLLLARHAAEVAKWCDEVIVSLDGSAKVHDHIRNVPRAFERLSEGVSALRDQPRAMRIGARCVLQRRNYFDVSNTIEAARRIGVDWISFLPADVSTEAFNREQPWDGTQDVALTPEETKHFALVIENVLHTHRKDFSSRFVRESPDKFRAMPRYFRALNEEDSFPKHACNAPWTSAVVDTDGSVQPCFFHRPYGNVRDETLESVLNSPEAIAFRKQLDVKTNPVCRRCVCSLNLRPHQRA